MQEDLIVESEGIRATPRKLYVNWTLETIFQPIQPEVVDFVMFEFQLDAIQNLGIPLHTSVFTPYHPSRSEKVNWIKEGF